MNERIQARDSVSVEVVRKGAPPVADTIQPRGRFVLEHWRGGKRINEYHFNNLVTNEGKNRLLNTMFKGTAAITSWYLGLVSSTSYTALAAGDTYANVGQAGNGWTEFTTYTDNVNAGSATTRPVWNANAASNQAITNTSVAIYDITTAGTVKGAFLVGGGSAQTKGDHGAGGVLWSDGLFTQGDVPVSIGDQLKLTYSVNS